MSHGHVLYLTDYQLQVFYVQGRRVTLLRSFSAVPEGHEAFAAYLREAHFKKVILLVNTRYEEYRIEKIPRLLAGDRAAMLQHKKRRMFPATPYSFATLLQQEPDPLEGTRKRHLTQDRVLFTCLNNPDFLRPWLSSLLARRIAIKGIVSVPLISSALLKYLPMDDCTLLVTYTNRIGEHNAYGLRQSYFFQQQLNVSRLIPLPSLSTQTYSDYVLTEIVKTQQYLHNAAFIPEDQSLSVVMVVPPTLLAPLQTHLTQHKTTLPIHYTLVDITQLANFMRFELDGEADSGASRELFVSSLLIWQSWVAGRNCYAQAHEIRYHTYDKIRMGIFAFAALKGLALFGYSTWLIYSTFIVQQQNARIQMEINQFEARIQNAQQETSNHEFNVIHIKNAVDAARYLDSRYVNPRQSMVLFSEYLNHYPEITLRNLEWESSQRKQPGQRRSGGLKGATIKVKQKMEEIEILQVDVVITHFVDVLDAVRTMKNFSATLEKDPAILSVESLQTQNNPINTRFSGELGMKRERPTEIPFKLKLIFRFDKQTAIQSVSLPEASIRRASDLK